MYEKNNNAFEHAISQEIDLLGTLSWKTTGRCAPAKWESKAKGKSGIHETVAIPQESRKKKKFKD